MTIQDVPKIRFPKDTRVTKSKQVVKLVKKIALRQQEFGIVVTLKPDYTVSNMRIVSIGNVREAVVSVRDILRGALIDGAYGIIFIHNHPSGSLKASKDDKRLVKDIRKAGKILDIDVVDVIIISGKKWRSIWYER